jgi:hypothetical protein
MNERTKFSVSVLTIFGALVLLAFTTRTHPAKAGLVVAAGAPTAARFSHTATLLPNNKVLIAGGMERNGVWLDSAELFDPATNRFASAGRMLSRRAGATATLLPSGKVLIAGGNDGSKTLASTEFYDPAANTFASGPAMTVPRSHPVAVTLRDGRLLIAGGNAEGDVAENASAEIYDPATGRFSPTGAMHTPRAAFAGVRLNDGKVLVVGGVSGGRYPDHRVESSAEIYDPATGKFAVTGSLSVPRYKLAVALLNDGRVLVVGGSDARDWRGTYSTTEIYSPTTGRFTPGPTMSEKRFKLMETALSLSDGRVLVAGGGDRPEVFDPNAGGFLLSSGDSLSGFFFSSATQLKDGRVLLVGGYGMDPGAGAVQHAWLWKP